MRKYTAYRVIGFLGLNGGLCGLIWLGFVEGHHGAENLAKFMIVFFAIMQAFFVSDDVLKSVIKAGAPSVPGPVAAQFGIFSVCVLAWQGHMVLAAVSAISWLFHSLLYRSDLAENGAPDTKVG